MIREEKRIGKQVGRVPESLALPLTPILCRSARDNFVSNQERPWTKVIQNILVSQTKTDLLGRGGRKIGELG